MCEFFLEKGDNLLETFEKGDNLYETFEKGDNSYEAYYNRDHSCTSLFIFYKLITKKIIGFI